MIELLTINQGVASSSLAGEHRYTNAKVRLNNDAPLKLKSKTVNLDQANGFIKHCPVREGIKSFPVGNHFHGRRR